MRYSRRQIHDSREDAHERRPAASERSVVSSYFEADKKEKSAPSPDRLGSAKNTNRLWQLNSPGKSWIQAARNLEEDKMLNTITDPISRPESRATALVTMSAICCGQFSTALVYDAFSPIMPNLVRHFGGGASSEWTVQAAMSLSVFGMAVAGIFASSLVSRFGFRTILFFAWLFFGMCGFAPMFVEGPSSLLISRFALGIFAGLLYALSGIAVAVRYENDVSGRTRFMGINMAAGPASALVFLFLAAWTARIVWYAPFGLYAAFGLLGMILVSFTNLPPARKNSTRHGVANLARGLAPALPAYGLILVALVLQNLFNVQIVFLLASRGMGDPSFVSTAISVMTIGMTPAYAFYSMVLDRLGLRRTVFTGFALQALAALLCAQSSHFYITVIGMAFAGVAIGFSVMSATQIIMTRTDSQYVSAALGLSSTQILLVSSLAPFVYVPLKAIVGNDGIYYVSATVVAIGLFAWAIFFRRTPLKAVEAD
jgi:MFS family permease